MIPRLAEVFTVREANVTSLAQINKVPIEFAQHVNQIDRQNADVLVKYFAHFFRKTHENSPSEKWISTFDRAWKNSGIEKLSDFLKKNPSKKNDILSNLNNPAAIGNIISTGNMKGQDLSSRASMTFPDGYYWVKLDPARGECRIEGGLMQHCGQNMNEETTMWSLRDKDGKPHVTMEIGRPGSDEYGNPSGNPVIFQCKGKQNKSPNKKYWRYIGEFAKKLHAGWGSEEEPMGNAEEFHDFLDQYGLAVVDV
jgi:hypothetical protein